MDMIKHRLPACIVSSSRFDDTVSLTESKLTSVPSIKLSAISGSGLSAP